MPDIPEPIRGRGGCGCAPTEWMWVCGRLPGARGGGVVHVAFITLPPYRLLVTRRQRFSGLCLVDTTRSCQNDGETSIDCEKKKAPSLLSPRGPEFVRVRGSPPFALIGMHHMQFTLQDSHPELEEQGVTGTQVGGA